MQTSSAGETMDVVTIEIFDHFWDRVKFGYAAAEGRDFIYYFKCFSNFSICYF